MTEDQKERFNKLTPLQQKVFTNVIAGMSPSEAHREAGGTCKNEENRRKLANVIMTNHDVKSLLEEMKQSSVNDAIMSRQEMMETLTRLSRVNLPINSSGVLDISQASPEQLEAIQQFQMSDTGIKISNYSKLAAMKQLADLAGYNGPIKVQKTGLEAIYDISATDPKGAAQEYLELIRNEYASIRQRMLDEDDC